MKLLALTGLHGAGKDTVADALPARKLAFADVLYREVAEAFGVTVADLRDRRFKESEQKNLAFWNCGDDDFRRYVYERYPNCVVARSPRQILQWWGDYRRAQSSDYFVQKLWDIFEEEPYSEPTVIPDCRFPNEARMVRQLSGQIWQVVRPGHEPPRTGHASETTGDEFAPDVVIINSGTVEELRAAALKEWNK